jgi:hypothetical protein
VVQKSSILWHITPTNGKLTDVPEEHVALIFGLFGQEALGVASSRDDGDGYAGEVMGQGWNTIPTSRREFVYRVRVGMWTIRG